MCWISKKVKEVKIATKPIKVYKVLRKDGTSPFRGFDYDNPIGKEYDLSDNLWILQTISFGNNYYIERGFHPYSLRPLRIKENLILGGSSFARCDYMLDHFVCYECEVPVGSEYAINEYGECVSNRIKFVKVFKQTFFDKLTNSIKLWYRF